MLMNQFVFSLPVAHVFQFYPREETSIVSFFEESFLPVNDKAPVHPVLVR